MIRAQGHFPVFLVQGGGIEAIRSELDQALAESAQGARLYYYAQEKSEVRDRDRWESLPGLYFEIIADVHGMTLDQVTPPIWVGIATTERVRDDALAWLKTQGVPGERGGAFSLPVEPEPETVP